MSTRADHVGLDTLADHLEGLLDADTAARVDAHLGDCGLCSALVEDLRGVSMLLSSQPTPSMPDDVRERIEQAVHAEHAGQAEHAAQAEQPGRAGLTDDDDARQVSSVDHARRRRTRLSRALLAAAAATVVVALGGVVLEEIGTVGSDTGSAGQAPAQEGGGDGPENALGAEESRPDAGADSGPDTLAEPPGPSPESRLQPSLIEEIYRTRTVTIQRERSACVGTAVDDPRWVGTSYAVQIEGRPQPRQGVVAFLGDADNTAPETTGVLIECRPEPTVLRREQLRR